MNEIASLEKVRWAAEALRKQGLTATADKVIRFIGGGSKATVLSHLRALRDEPVGASDVPSSVMELARPVLGEIYRAGRAAEAENHRTTTARLSSVIEELDAQVEELIGLNTELETRNAGLRKDLEQIADLRDRVRAADAENAVLRAELVRERDEGNDSIRKTLGRLTTLLEPTTGKKPMNDRQTLTLPRNPRQATGGK
nr:DNA-binding protein [uncultured Devosia sp.]